MSRAPCRPNAATVSGAENFHPGKIDCTISKPCATQSMLSSNALSPMSGAGATASLKTISGSIRGSARPTSGNVSPLSERLCTRAIVNISPDRFVHVVFGPNRVIRESNLSSYGQLPADLAHLPHCSGYTVCIVEIERRKPRREWLNLTTGIEGGERLGSNCLNADQCIQI